MEFLIRKVLGAIAGVAICIAIWTIQDRLTGGGDNTIKSIPTVVWGGGAGVVTIEAEASAPANISVSFVSNLDDDREYLETWQEIPAGKTTFDIDVPADVSGEVWVRIDEPEVGAKVKVTVRSKGSAAASRPFTSTATCVAPSSRMRRSTASGVSVTRKSTRP